MAPGHHASGHRVVIDQAMVAPPILDEGGDLPEADFAIIVSAVDPNGR